MKKLMLLLLSAGLFTLANAQTLECENLLSNYPQPSVEITTVVQQTTSEVSVDGQSGQTLMTQTFDYPNRRLIQEAEVGGIKTVMRYADGKLGMSMVVGGEAMDVPVPSDDETVASFESLFDQPLFQGVPQNVTVVSCDGQQSYADLISGEQVTVTTTVPNMGELTSRILFGPDGATQGIISTPPAGFGGEMLIVFEELTLDEASVPTHMKMTTYRLEDGAATLFNTTIMDILSYNQPIDESLFAPAE
jgi:hypothetical protein